MVANSKKDDNERQQEREDKIQLAHGGDNSEGEYSGGKEIDDVYQDEFSPTMDSASRYSESDGSKDLKEISEAEREAVYSDSDASDQSDASRKAYGLFAPRATDVQELTDSEDEYHHPHNGHIDDDEVDEDAELLGTRIALLLTPALDPEEPECSICLEFYGIFHRYDDEIPHKLPCGHIFGHSCITRWMAENDTCPICRRDYTRDLFGEDPKDDEGYVADDEDSRSEGHDLEESVE